MERVTSTRNAYCGLLAKLSTYYAKIEPRIGEVGAWTALGLDGRQRERSHLIARDLSDLGVNAAPDEGLEIPSIRSIPDGLGCLYVLEGSNLGGLVISKGVRERLGPEIPCAFFSGSGNQTGARWREFGQAIESYSRLNGGKAEMITAAKATFTSLTSWLREGSYGSA